MIDWIQNNWLSALSWLMTVILVPLAFYFGQRQHQIKDDHKSCLSNLLEDLTKNLHVAQKKDAWSKYSLQGQSLIGSLSSVLDNGLKECLRVLYTDLETTNRRIDSVKGGRWSNELYQKYYSDFIHRFEGVLEKIRVLV